MPPRKFEEFLDRLKTEPPKDYSLRLNGRTKELFKWLETLDHAALDLYTHLQVGYVIQMR